MELGPAPPTGCDTERLTALSVVIHAVGAPIRAVAGRPEGCDPPCGRDTEETDFPNKTKPEDAFASSGLAKETSVRN